MLNEQLKKQIRNEATSSAANFHYYPGSEQFEDMETAYEIGAFKYAEKWQQAQQLIDETTEKIIDLMDFVAEAKGHVSDEEIIAQVRKSLPGLLEALTPKTGSDE